MGEKMQSKDVAQENEILYIETSQFFVIILFSNLIYYLIIGVYFKLSNVVMPLLSISYLVELSCMLIITSSTYKIYKTNYLNLIRLVYFGIIIIYININVSHFKYGDLVNFTRYNSLISSSIWICLISFLYLFSWRYFTSKKQWIIRYFISILILILINKSLIVSKYSGITIITLNLIAILTTIKTKRYFEIFKIRVKGQINYMSLGGYSIIVISILNLISLNTNSSKYILIINIIRNGMIFVGFSTMSTIIVEKVINKPHKSIFKQIYNQNKELDKLNREIKLQNKELELSQIIINKKKKMIRSFFGNIPIALIVINKNTRRITFANKSFMDLIEEESIKNIINKRYTNFFNIEDNVHNNEGKFLIRGNIVIKNKKKIVTIEVSDEGENNEVIIYFTDITEMVKIYEMKETLKIKDFEEKIKRDFLSNISHDLKTPVNVIYAASQLEEIYMREKNYEGINKYNKISKQNCISLTRFTNNIINKSKMYSENLPVDLKVNNIVEVIEKTVLSLVDYAKNKSVELIFDTDEEELYVKIDCDFMQRIIINIISNSIKYCNDKGQIYVIVKDYKKEIKVIIKDNGIGMDEEFLRIAFSRYSMGKSNETSVEKGTGIGLFVVKELVEEQGGKIDITSKVNEGTKTELTFSKVVEN